MPPGCGGKRVAEMARAEPHAQTGGGGQMNIAHLKRTVAKIVRGEGGDIAKAMRECRARARAAEERGWHRLAQTWRTAALLLDRRVKQETKTLFGD
jgi:hypothetical protein